MTTTPAGVMLVVLATRRRDNKEDDELEDDKEVAAIVRGGTSRASMRISQRHPAVMYRACVRYEWLPRCDEFFVSLFESLQSHYPTKRVLGSRGLEKELKMVGNWGCDEERLRRVWFIYASEALFLETE